MDEERDDDFSYEEAKELTNKFEESLQAGGSMYFDSQELENMMDFCIEDNRLATALAVSEMALSQNPHSEFFLLRKAQLLAAEGKYHQGLEILGKVELMSPGSADVLITKGTIYSQMGMNKNALQCFNQAIEVAEFPDEVYMFIAFEYENLGSYEMALKNLIKASEINRENDAVLFEIGFCFETLNKTSEAIAFFNKVIDHHPYSMPGWYSLGLFLNKNEEFEKALDAYDYAIAIDGEFASSHFNRANTLANLLRYRDAIEAYNEALKFEPVDQISYFYIGECYEQLGEGDKAIVNYEKAIKLDETYPEPWFGIAMVLEQQDRNTEAYHFIKKATEFAPGNAEFLYLRGDIEKKCGLTDEAIASYRKVTETDPDLVDIWLDLADLLFVNQEVAEALEVITEGIKNHPDEADFYYKMVAFLLELGMKQNAFEVMQTALEFDASKHESLFNFFPKSKEIPEILDLIQIHRK